MKETIKILVLVATVMTIMLLFMGVEGVTTAAKTQDVPAETETAEPEITKRSAEDNTGVLLEEVIIFEITEEERQIIEQVVMAEARGESLEGQMAVAQTIRDRCIARGQDPIKVCTSPNQYAISDLEPTDRVKDAVMFIFDYGHSVFEEPTFYFYQSEMIEEPEYLAEKTLRGQIGPHRFYG